MALGDVACDMQPEPHSVRMARSRFGPSERRLQHPTAVAFGNARAVVDDSEGPCVAGPVEHDRNVAVRFVVADRVLHDVAECLLEQREVARKLDHALWHANLEGDLLSLRDRSMAVDDAFDEPVQVDRVLVRKPFTGL